MVADSGNNRVQVRTRNCPCPPSPAAVAAALWALPAGPFADPNRWLASKLLDVQVARGRKQDFIMITDIEARCTISQTATASNHSNQTELCIEESKESGIPNFRDADSVIL